MSNSQLANVLYWQDFLKLSSQMGFSSFRNTRMKNSDEIVRGNMRCRRFPGGMSVHYGTIEELQDASNSSELPPGISFNLVLEGDALFALSGQRHQLRSNEKLLEPECCTLVLDKPEVMTRFIQRNNKLTKINIFLEKTWLEDRISVKGATDCLLNFSQSSAVIHWSPSSELVKMGWELLDFDPSESLAKSLLVESKVLALAETFIREFLALPKNNFQHKNALGHIGKNWEVIVSLLEKYWQPGMSLEELAEKMNMSTSTLQRRFKEVSGLTVIEFLRQRRLIEARSQLLDKRISIGEAAYISGYQHSSNFITAFKRCFGVTPKQLLKSHHR